MPTSKPPQFGELAQLRLDAIQFLPEPSKVLEYLGFYNEYELPSASRPASVGEAEQEVISEILGRLYRAALIALETKPAVVASTLQHLVRNPDRYQDVPESVFWPIASCYRRAGEEPATYWADVLNSAPLGYQHDVAPPTADNISRSASLALTKFERSPSGPSRPEQTFLAETLGSLFLRFNEGFGRIVEKDTNTKQYKERGLFADFLDLVLVELNRVLESRGCRRLNRDTIVGIASKSPRARRQPWYRPLERAILGSPNPDFSSLPWISHTCE